MQNNNNSLAYAPNLDIIQMDETLKQTLQNKKALPLLKRRLKQLQLLKDKSVSPAVLIVAARNIEIEITEIEQNHQLKMYIAESIELIEKFKNILNKPIQVSFMGPRRKVSPEKNNVINMYMSVYQRYAKTCSVPQYWKEETGTDITKDDDKVCCNKSCESTTFSNVLDSLVCDKCYCVQEMHLSTTSYADIDRVNVSSRYLYDRKVHFRDCILQFQGRQNVTIDRSVYDSLENEFDKHHLLVGDEDTPIHIRFSNITKEHINMFLKELRLSKHYENVQLIHYNLTGLPCPNIKYLEGELLQDFEELTVMYDIIYKGNSRKNFINTQYVLFQLLKRHKYPCDASDFSILKTSERRDWHHRVCKCLFSKLSWNFTSV
jgi:hypothetical protein